MPPQTQTSPVHDDYDDSQSRQDILETTQSIIVKAPAGSGKTELLVQRYLNLLAKACDNPRQIIAITFTRKAAAEMRARIRGELQRKAEPLEKHKQQTFRIAQAVLARAAEKGWEMDRLVSQDTVTTIDAFCRALVALDPIKANFFTMPDLLEDYEADRVYQQAVEESIRTIMEEEDFKKLKENLKELIYMHNNDLVQLKQNFAQLLKQRAPLLLAIMKEDINLQSDMQTLCAALVSRIYKNAPLNLLAQAPELMRQAAQDLQQQGEEDRISFSESFSGDWQQASLPQWQKVAQFLLTQGKPLKKVDKRHGFSSRTAHKAAMMDLLQELGDAAEPQEDGHPSQTGEFIYYLSCAHSWSSGYEKQELETAQAAIQLFKLAVAQLQRIFKGESNCDYTEIMLAALEVMEQEKAPSLLAERLGYQLRHILVDEFQDTSTGQLRLLESLSRSWDASSSNSLFLVGDPMQSIYAFRQADVRIFNRLWEKERLGQVPLKRVTLKRNFRSQQDLVSWCNDRFRTIFPPVADNLMDAVVHTAASGIHSPKESGLCLLGVREDADDSLSGETLFMPMVKEIKELLKQSPLPTIAILTPTRNHIRELIPLLQQEKLNFNAAQISACNASPHIMDLLSLTRALYDYSDELSWYACLRAPWCGLKLEDLLFISHNKKERTIWQFLCGLKGGKHKKGFPSPDSAKRLRHFVNCLEDGAERTRRANWSDLILSAWRRLGGDGLLKTEQDRHETELFFSLLQENTNGALLALDSLASQLSERGAVFQNESPIQIMTIHKAKGLEFDYVFLPVTHKERGRSSEMEVLLAGDFYLDDAQRSFSLFAAHSPTAAEDGEPAYRMLRHLKQERERQEYRRLFYVACTRAKRRLYLHYLVKYDDKPKAPPLHSFLHLLWQQIRNELIEKSKKIRMIAAMDTALPPLKRIFQLPKVPPIVAGESLGAAPLLSWNEPLERTQGLLIHRFMDSLTRMAPSLSRLEQSAQQQELIAGLEKDLSLYQSELAEAGFNSSQSQKLIQAGLTAARNTVADPRGRWLISRHGQSEWTLARRARSSIRLDRTFIDQDARWIIDYKTSMDPSTPFSKESLKQFEKQLNGYAVAISALDKEHPIILAIYCPQNGYWKEWNYAAQEDAAADNELEWDDYEEYTHE